MKSSRNFPSVLLVLSVFLAVAAAATAFASDTTEIKTDQGAQVQVSEDGSVNLSAGGNQVKVDAGSVELSGDSEAPATSTGAGATLAIDGTGKKIVHTCDATHARAIELSGSGQALELKGECERLEVSGTNNTVTAEALGAIEVSGVANKVAYKKGLAEKLPKIEQSGLNNSVTQITE
ncbi:MAG: DUF3060 domain-containing protein [Candidatus Schekmanbacteria bacterium]|nr:DUF3060 domain-containing protein [Candidatus Schekmanbacteria bacterium]